MENTESDVPNPKGELASRKVLVLLVIASSLTFLGFGGLPLSCQWAASGKTSFQIQLFPMIAWVFFIWTVGHVLKRRRQFRDKSRRFKITSICLALFMFSSITYGLSFLVLAWTGIITPKVPVAAAAGWNPMGLIENEIWNIDGEDFRLNSTYYITVQSDLQYTIEYQTPQAIEIKSEEDALKIAFPIIAHAYKSKLYKRLKIAGTEGKREVKKIGVALFVKEGMNSKGYRVSLNLEDIQKRIAQELE